MKSFGVTIQMNPLWQNIFLVIFISWDFYENRFENFVIFRPLSGRNSRVERLRRSEQ